jgi:hypothetical protein
MKIKKQSLIAALFNFRQELKDLNIPEKQLTHFMQAFKDAYEHSGDYDLAENTVFEEVMDYVNNTRKSQFRAFWKDRMGSRKRTVHFSDLDNTTYLSILEQLREAVKEGVKQGRTEEEIAGDFAREYNLFFNDVFHWVWNRMNTKADLFGTYDDDQSITKQREDKLVNQARSIINRGQRNGQVLTDIIGAIALGLGISYAMALKVAQKAKPDFGEKYFGNQSIQLG